MSTPIDVRTEFGNRWRIGLDEAAHGRWSDPWNYKILCHHGEICPWGGDLLAASTDSAGKIANKLRALPFVEVVQDGRDGVTVIFHRRHLRAVAGIIKPRCARKANPAQLAALASGRRR